MSALQQLMGNYSRDIQALSQHAEDHNEEVADRKANDVNEQFNNYIDHIASGAQDLGSAAAAWHLGRKIYTKYQEKHANKPGQSGDSDNTSSAQSDAQADGAGGDASDETIARAQGAGTDPISTEDSFFPGSARDADADAVFRDDPGNLNLKARARAQAAQEAPEGEQGAGPGADAGPAPEPSAPEVQPQSTTTTTIQSDPGARTTQGEFGGQVGDTTGEFADEPSGQQGVSLRSQRVRNVEPAQGDQGSPGSQVNRTQIETAGEDLEEGDEGLASRLGSGIKNMVGGAKGAIGDALDSVGNMAKQTASKAASSLKSLLPDSVNDALDTGLMTTDAVLDGIPVVGEVASVITGLVALFEGIGNKPKTAEDESAQAAKEAPGTAVAGVDPAALVKQQAVNLVA